MRSQLVSPGRVVGSAPVACSRSAHPRPAGPGRHAAGEQRPSPAAAGAGSRPSGRLRVLVADDDHSIRMLCRVNLELAGFEVLEAEDGDEALREIAASAPDIALLDVMMPLLDGWQLASRLAESASTRDLPIVFLSARAGHDDRRRGFDLGAVGYLVKPFDPVALGDTLKRILDRLAHGEREALRREIME
jgi:DNA-binding response OmpR family regulator